MSRKSTRKAPETKARKTPRQRASDRAREPIARPRATGPRNTARAPRARPLGPVDHAAPAAALQPGDDVASELAIADRVDDAHDGFYPLFPAVKRGDIHAVRVFRKRPKADGTKGTSWVRIGLPFDAATLTWDLIISCCGGGSFAVQALGSRNQVVGSAQETFEGEERTPRAAEAMRAAQGLDTSQVTETPMGWLAIPGHSSEIQALFMAYQQVAFFAREDFHRMLENNSLMMEKVSEYMMRPNPALGILQEHIAQQRVAIERLSGELANVRSQYTSAQIESAQSTRRADHAKAKLYEKAVDMADNFAGAVLTKWSESEAAKGAAGAAAGSLPAGASTATVQTIARTP